MSNHIVAAKPRYRVTVQFYGETEVEVEAANEEQAEQEAYEKICDWDEAFVRKTFGEHIGNVSWVGATVECA
jgi:hypothetical protein